MSTRTRHLVFVAALFLALAIPAESILLRALVQPSEQAAVQDWVSSLDQAELSGATDVIQLYPLAYRREIMRRQSPEGRSRVWRSHLQAYLNAHSEVDTTTAGLLKTALELLTPAFFDQPSDAARASLRTVAEQIQTALGREEAEYLLYRLGPRDGTFASFEPMAMYLGNKVRGFIQMNAAATSSCECATYWGCYTGTYLCSQAVSCSTDSSWPMCGWAWSDPCDGLCSGD